MRTAITRRFLPVAVLLTVWAAADTADAQFGPGYSYGGWGAYPYANLRSTQNTSMELAASARRQSEQRAMKQNLTVQQGIRSTLSSQAQARTQAIQAEGQSNRDWWFQQQQQQVAQGPRSGARSPLPFVPSVAAMTPSTQPAASKGIIAWPQVLLDPRFAAARATVEDPYRQDRRPTPDDYRAMTGATTDMKTTLEGLATEVSAAEYMATVKFLDTLAAEAQGRLEPKEATSAGAES